MLFFGLGSSIVGVVVVEFCKEGSQLRGGGGGV